MNESYRALIESERVGEATRVALTRRAITVDHGQRLLSETHYATLDAVIQRLLPQSASETFVDIANEVDAALHEDIGDGWRYADLPPDAEAFAAGLQWIESLSNDRHHASFVKLDHATQDRLLREIFAGEIRWESMNVRHWCEDLLALATKIYVSHPATLARIGFSGFAFRPEWRAVGLGTTRPWESAAL